MLANKQSDTLDMVTCIHTCSYDRNIICIMYHIRPYIFPIIIICLLCYHQDGAGASSLSEKDKEMAKVIEQLMEREDEVTELKKQLQLKTMEATTVEERKYQLEQELTHMVDGTGVMAERAEIEKERQDMEAERRHYKRMEAQTVTLQAEIEQLKQRLLHHAIDKQIEV